MPLMLCVARVGVVSGHLASAATLPRGVPQKLLQKFDKVFQNKTRTRGTRTVAWKRKVKAR